MVVEGSGAGFIAGVCSRMGSDGCGRDSAFPGDVGGAGPLCSVERNAMWPVDQSINRLYCLSQELLNRKSQAM